jgi:voltage-gated potassium channel
MTTMKESRPSTPPDEPGRQDRTPETMLKGLVEIGLIALAFIWMGLFIIEMAYGLSPVLTVLFNVIWVIFIIDFAVELALASDKVKYLKSNWLTAVSLVIPALRILRVVRVLRILRLARVVRGIWLIRLLTSLRRAMRALGHALNRRGFGYVIALTVIVVLAGAAGMYAFERGTPGQPGFTSYADALWWTAMIVTTMGSQYWPVTPEGRILCLLLSLYAFTVFGYITAVLASYFVGRDTAAQSGAASAQTLRALQDEVAALRRQTPTQERNPADP